MDLDDLAAQLYSLPPEDFTAARNAAAAAVRDPGLAKTIRALRKPTASAHAVNGIVREHPDRVDELLDLGAALRAAMTGPGADMRELTERRRRLVAELVPRGLPAAVRDDVVATLEAATADAGLGAAVRSGRLVKPLHYAGFGPLPDAGDAVAVTAGTARTARSRDGDGKQPTLAALRQRVLDLAGAADDAQRAFEEASRAVTAARATLERAEAEQAAAHQQARDAHAAAEKARRELGRRERT